MSRTIIDIFVQRLTTLVRGPARLREDIADEIADHLASRIEEETAHAGGHPDAARIEAEAIRAFGDPQQIARELRNIHMGDWIMFQKIMVAALVVIVIGMAVTAYFSWSAAREQARQLEGMNNQLTALVELQQTAPQRALDAAAQREAAAKAEEEKKLQEAMRKAAVPQTKIYFYLGDKSKPAANYPVKLLTLVSNQVYNDRFDRTDEKGFISLPSGIHRITGEVLPPDRVVYAGEPTWSRVVEIKHEMPDVSLEVNVSPRTVYQIELDLSAVTWNREMPRRVEVYCRGREGRVYNTPGQSFAEREWTSPKHALTWPAPGKTAEITGLYPGEAYASVWFYPNPDDIVWRPEVTPEQKQEFSSKPVLFVDQPLKVSEAGGTISLKLRPEPKNKLFGVIHEGSREKPVVGVPVRHAFSLSPPDPPRRTTDRPAHAGQVARSVATEYLTTSASGEFVLLGTSNYVWGTLGKLAITFPWHTADGREVPFTWPLSLLPSYPLTDDGTFYEMDMSKVGTARLVFEGVQELVNEGHWLAGPVIIGDLSYRSGNSYTNVAMHFPETRFDPIKTRSVDLLMVQSYSLDEQEPAGTQPAEGPASRAARAASRRPGVTAPSFAAPAGANPPQAGDAYHRLTLQFVTSRPKEGSPDLVAETTHTREFFFAIAGGRITEIPVTVNELSKWKASEPKWRRVEAATQTAPE